MTVRSVPPTFSGAEIAELIRDFRVRIDGLRDRVNILIAAQAQYQHNPQNPDAPLYATWPHYTRHGDHQPGNSSAAPPSVNRDMDTLRNPNGYETIASPSSQPHDLTTTQQRGAIG